MSILQRGRIHINNLTEVHHEVANTQHIHDCLPFNEVSLQNSKHVTGGLTITNFMQLIQSDLKLSNRKSKRTRRCTLLWISLYMYFFPERDFCEFGSIISFDTIYCRCKDTATGKGKGKVDPVSFLLF
jgi:hypothetical protein